MTKTQTKHYIRIADHSQLIEQGHTPDDWYKMIDDLKRCVVKIPSWVYYHFLEAVPPIYPQNDIGFFNSEPIEHTHEGVPLYYYFSKLNGCYYGMATTIETQAFCLQLAKESINSLLSQESLVCAGCQKPLNTDTGEQVFCKRCE